MFVEVEIIYNYLSFLLQIHICFRGVSFESNILKIMFFFWFFYLFLCGWNRLWGGEEKGIKENSEIGLHRSAGDYANKNN